MTDFVEREFNMTTFNHHFPTIGIYGRIPGVTIQTSLHAACWDQGWNVIFVGDATDEHDVDFAVELAADNVVITGLKDGGTSVIDLQGIEIYGSGTGKVTSTIKNAMKSGQVVVFGLPEDEVALVEQEDVAQTIVMVLFEHINSGPQGTVPAWGIRSKVQTLGEVAAVIYRQINAYFEYLGSTQQAQFVPFVDYPVVSERTDRGNSFGRSGKPVLTSDPDAITITRELERTPAKYFNGYTDLNHGVKTTIYRLASEGHQFKQPRAARYALPREMLFEMTHDKNYYDPNSYLLDME